MRRRVSTAPLSFLSWFVELEAPGYPILKYWSCCCRDCRHPLPLLLELMGSDTVPAHRYSAVRTDYLNFGEALFGDEEGKAATSVVRAVRSSGWDWGRPRLSFPRASASLVHPASVSPLFAGFLDDSVNGAYGVLAAEHRCKASLGEVRIVAGQHTEAKRGLRKKSYINGILC